jgi:putative N6-adenine-specific DNA methylase
VAAELRTLGVNVSEVEPAGVAFDATQEELFRVNCWSRLASRVIVRLDRFEARDFATLEKRSQRVPWSEILSSGDTAELSITCRKSRLYHSDAVAERVARGIERSLPGVRTAAARGDEDDAEPIAHNNTSSRTQRILVRLDHDVCTISADASGQLLHRRGWRLDSGKAPLRETLAAALLVASEWPSDAPLVDPMCGAGTIAIEAALVACNIAPGLSRTYSCEFWPRVDVTIAERIRADARSAQRKAPAVIVAGDRDAGAIEATRTNAERAGVLDSLTIVHQPLSDIDLAQYGARGWVVTNPPYGIRTGNVDTLHALWGRLGAVVRTGGTGWTLGVVVPDPSLAREIRLSLERVVNTSTGGRQVSFSRSRPPR